MIVIDFSRLRLILNVGEVWGDKSTSRSSPLPLHNPHPLLSLVHLIDFATLNNSHSLLSSPRPGRTNLLSLGVNSILPAALTHPSLLTYFLNLTMLHTWNHNARNTIPWDKFMEEVSRYCPRFAAYGLEESPGAFVLKFLAKIAGNNVSQIEFKYGKISIDTMMAISMHYESQESVEQFKPVVWLWS